MRGQSAQQFNWAHATASSILIPELAGATHQTRNQRKPAMTNLKKFYASPRSSWAPLI